MSGTSMKLVAFLITAHLFLFWAGMEGYRPSQVGANPHEKYVEGLSGDSFQSNVSVTSSGVVNTYQPVSYQSLNGLNYLKGILFSPYNLFSDSQLPPKISFLFSAIIGAMEILVILYALRGAIF